MGGSDKLNLCLVARAYRASSDFRKSGWSRNKFGRVTGSGRLVFNSRALRARYRAANSSRDTRGTANL